MSTLSVVSTSVIPAVNRAGKIMIGAERHAAGGLACGDGEQADLGRGVEAEPEQKADRKHLPAARHHAEQRPENAGQQAAAGEQQVQLLLGDRLAAPRAAKALPDAAQNDEIDDRDGEQEESRCAGADDAADRFEFGESGPAARTPPPRSQRPRARSTANGQARRTGRPRPAVCLPASACARHCRWTRCDRHRRRGAGRAHKRGRRCRSASAGPPARSAAQVQTSALAASRKA